MWDTDLLGRDQAQAVVVHEALEVLDVQRRKREIVGDGGVTLWLNSGVPAPEAARRAGHSVDVLLKIYAGCIDDGTAEANGKIEQALGE